MITDESEKDWKIKTVESAWVEKVDDESQLYAGPVQYWIRGERQLEYVVNGYSLSPSLILITTFRTNMQKLFVGT